MPKKLTPYQIMRQQMDKNYAQMYDTSLARRKAVKPTVILSTQQNKVYPTNKQLLNTILNGGKNKRSQYDIIGDKTYNDLKEMNKVDLIKDIKTLQKQANTRLTQIAKANEDSFAKTNIDEKYLKDSKFKVDFTKMNKNQLIGYFNELNKFLTSKTSTVKGVREVRANINERLNINFTKEQQDDLWEVYNKIKEGKGNAKIKEILRLMDFDDSDQLQKYIAEKVKNSGKTADEIAIEITNHIEDLYKAEQRANYESPFDTNKRFR